MNYLKNNKEFLKGYRTDLLELVRNYEKNNRYAKNIEWDEAYKEIKVRQGKKEIYLHSIYNKEREVEELVKGKPKYVEQICLFGMPDILQLKKTILYFKRVKRIFIVVPSSGIFYKWLQNNLLEEIVNLLDENIKQGEMVLVVEDQFSKVSNLIKSIAEVGQHEKIILMAFISYFTLFTEFFLEICKTVKMALVDKGIMHTTRKLWRDSWLIHNWTILQSNTIPIKRLEKLFSENICVVVAAGASLEKNMELLKDVYDRAIIIAAGSAGQILNKNEIKPHFNMGVDGSDLCNKVFAPLKESNVPLVCAHSFYSPLVEEYNGDVFTLTIGAMDKVAVEAYKFSGEDFLISSGGLSVVNIAHAISVQMGCKKIIFLGQDCCYTRKKLHAQGSWTEGTKYQNKYNEREEEIFAKDINGENVITSEVLLSLNRAITSFVKNNNSCKFINCTEGGLDISGATNRKLKDVIEKDMKKKIDISAEISNIAKEYKENYSGIVKSKLRAFAQKYRNEMMVLKELLLKQNNYLAKINIFSTKEEAYCWATNAIEIFEDIEKNQVFSTTMNENFIFDINEVLMLDTGEYTYELLEGLRTVNKRLLEHVNAAVVLAEEYLQERPEINRVIFVRQ